MKKTIETFSKYKAYKKRHKILIISLRLLLLVGFFGLWELLTALNIIDSFLISSPSAIIKLFIIYCQSGTLGPHIGISVYETVLGLIIGTTAGLIIGMLLYLFKNIYELLDPFLVVLNALPKTALAPIIIIWIGTGVKGIVAVSISLSLISTILTAYSYFINVDPDKVAMLKTYHASRMQILTKLIIPSNIVNIISIIKINIGMSWVGVIVGEFLVSRQGLGYLVVYGGQVFQLDLVMMGVLILSAIAFIMYEILNLLEIYVRKKRNRRR